MRKILRGKKVLHIRTSYSLFLHFFTAAKVILNLFIKGRNLLIFN